MSYMIMNEWIARCGPDPQILRRTLAAFSRPATRLATTVSSSVMRPTGHQAVPPLRHPIWQRASLRLAKRIVIDSAAETLCTLLSRFYSSGGCAMNASSSERVSGCAATLDRGAAASGRSDKPLVVPIQRDQRCQRYSPTTIVIGRVPAESIEKYEMRLQSVSQRERSHRLGVRPTDELGVSDREQRTEMVELATIELTGQQMAGLRDDILCLLNNVTPRAEEPGRERLLQLAAQIVVAETELSRRMWQLRDQEVAAPEAKDSAALSAHADSFLEANARIEALTAQLAQRGCKPGSASAQPAAVAAVSTLGATRSPSSPSLFTPLPSSPPRTRPSDQYALDPELAAAHAALVAASAMPARRGRALATVMGLILLLGVVGTSSWANPAALLEMIMHWLPATNSQNWFVPLVPPSPGQADPIALEPPTLRAEPLLRTITPGGSLGGRPPRGGGESAPNGLAVLATVPPGSTGKALSVLEGAMAPTASEAVVSAPRDAAAPGPDVPTEPPAEVVVPQGAPGTSPSHLAADVASAARATPLTAATATETLALAPPIALVSLTPVAKTDATLSPFSTTTVPAASAPVPHLVIGVRADSWIRVRDSHGTVYFARILKGGETWTVPPMSGLQLTTGNAGATFLVVDGVRGAPLGSEGAVRSAIALDSGG
jgi:hypothetical protein